MNSLAAPDGVAVLSRGRQRRREEVLASAVLTRTDRLDRPGRRERRAARLRLQRVDAVVGTARATAGHPRPARAGRRGRPRRLGPGRLVCCGRGRQDADGQRAGGTPDRRPPGDRCLPGRSGRPGRRGTSSGAVTAGPTGSGPDLAQPAGGRRAAGPLVSWTTHSHAACPRPDPLERRSRPHPRRRGRAAPVVHGVGRGSEGAVPVRTGRACGVVHLRTAPGQLVVVPADHEPPSGFMTR